MYQKEIVPKLLEVLGFELLCSHACLSFKISQILEEPVFKLLDVTAELHDVTLAIQNQG